MDCRSSQEARSAEREGPRPAASPEAALCVRRLSKRFRRFARRGDRFRQLVFPRRRYYDEFWALRDVSLEVGRGETVGIMGRNGSGKSTLLQIICGTLTPSGGEVETRGRIAALLELGAGFHPEFSGRDNVYTNAAILGFGEREIDDRFDQIVAFAELEEFIDQPVKTYSSGMFVRLAFAVAISVEPDILVVDEALAVGDAAFQSKCYGRIRDIQRRGGTILFVSHAAAAVLELCNRAVLLDRGEVLLDADPRTVVTRYHKLIFSPPERLDAVREEVRRPVEAEPGGRDESPPRAVSAPPPEKAYFDPGLRPSGTVRYEPQGAEIVDPRITTLDGETVNVLLPDEEYLVRYRVRFHQDAYSVLFGSMFKTVRGVELTTMAVPRGCLDYAPAGSEVEVEFRFRCLLVPETYFVNVGVHGTAGGHDGYLHRITDALALRVLAGDQRASGGLVDLYTGHRVVFTHSVKEAAA
jgi:lipopolysaccharide transport system ATP-binding protein